MISKYIRVFSRFPINRNFANALTTGYGLMGLTIIVQLVLIPLYLTHLGKEKFGILTMILSAINFAAIGVGWLSGGLARILAERAAIDDIEGFKSGYALAKWLYVGYSVIAVLMFWIMAPWLLPYVFEDSEVLKALLLASIYLILLYEYNADRIAFNACHKQGRANSNEIVGQIVFAIGVLAGLKANGGLVSIIAAQIGGLLVVRVLAWFHWRKDSLQLGWMKSIPGYHDIWSRVSGKMGLGYVVYGVLLLSLQADALILGWLTTPETVANYYLVWRIPEVVILVLWRIPGSYAPFLIAMDVKGESDRLQKNYKCGLYFMLGISGIATIIYGTLGQLIVTVWVGDNAPDGNLPYFLASMAMFFLGVSRWPSGVAYSLLNIKPLNWIIAAELVAKMALVLSFFPSLGYYTPMLATTVIHGFLVFYLYLWLGYSTISFSINEKE